MNTKQPLRTRIRWTLTRLYRWIFDYPNNWQPYGWQWEDLTEFYRSGKHVFRDADVPVRAIIERPQVPPRRALSAPPIADIIKQQAEATMICLVDGSNGIFIPKIFAERANNPKFVWKHDDRGTLLEGPDATAYWEAWDDVLDYFSWEHNGHRWTLHHDMDLFAVREDHKWEVA